MSTDPQFIPPIQHHSWPSGVDVLSVPSTNPKAVRVPWGIVHCYHTSSSDISLAKPDFEDWFFLPTSAWTAIRHELSAVFIDSNGTVE